MSGGSGMGERGGEIVTVGAAQEEVSEEKEVSLLGSLVLSDTDRLPLGPGDKFGREEPLPWQPTTSTRSTPFSSKLPRREKLGIGGAIHREEAFATTLGLGRPLPVLL